MYLKKNAGVTTSGGIEYLPISWDKKLYEWEGTRLAQNTKDDALFKVYWTLGGFYDFRIKDTSGIRLFANAGLAFNYFFGGRYNGTIDSYTYTFTSSIYYRYTPKIEYFNITFPLTLGARYYFATHHGIEAVAKFYAGSLDYSLDGNGFIPYKTKISHNSSFGLRYVYEFK